MAVRREGRESAVQFLYQRDIQGEAFLKERDLDQALAEFWRFNQRPRDARDFAEELIRGILEKLPEVDKRIQDYAANWDMDRMAPVDRNILRLGVYELFHCDQTPPVVAINEAIDIAKEFSTDDSYKFVNGILDRAKQEVLRPLRHPAG